MDFKKRSELKRFTRNEIEHWKETKISLTFQEYILLRLLKTIEDEIED